MLYLQIRYNIKKDSFEINSNIDSEKLKEVVSEFLRTQMGLGKDTREAAEKDIYEIEIKLDLSEDTFHVSANTNNDSLTTGIVSHYLQTL